MAFTKSILSGKNKQQTEHAICLNTAVLMCQSADLILTKSEKKDPTLLARIVHKVDVTFYAGETMSEMALNHLFSELKYAETSKRLVMNNTQSSSKGSGKSYRRNHSSSFNGSTNSKREICRNFNSAGGCYYDNCRFDHSCQKHWKLKREICNHSAVDCDLA